MGIQRKTKGPELVTRRELVDELKISPRTFAKWLEEGLPVEERGRGGRPSKYNREAVLAWKVARDGAASSDGKPGLTALEARANKDKWQAELAKQTHQLRARELLPAAEVEAAWGRIVAAVRARVLALPVALADRLERVAKLEGVGGVQRALEDAAHSLLLELSELDVGASSPPPAPAARKRGAARKKSTPARARSRRRRKSAA